MRYALASALMDDGYFAIRIGAKYHDVAKFDELAIPLGAALEGPQAESYKDGTVDTGVYMRRFVGGLAIVNPRTNPDVNATLRGDVTITIPTSMGLFKRFLGSPDQDPVTNNGQKLPLSSSGRQTITIKAGDGIILVRQ